MAGLFAHAGCLLLHLKRNPLFEITIPSKTMAYLGSGRPILAAVAGDAAAVVANGGAGLTCPPEDPKAMANAIREMYHKSPKEREAMGYAGRHLFEREFAREVVINKYSALFEQMVKERRAPQSIQEKNR